MVSTSILPPQRRKHKDSSQRSTVEYLILQKDTKHEPLIRFSPSSPAIPDSWTSENIQRMKKAILVKSSVITCYNSRKLTEGKLGSSTSKPCSIKSFSTSVCLQKRESAKLVPWGSLVRMGKSATLSKGALEKNTKHRDFGDGGNLCQAARSLIRSRN